MWGFGCDDSEFGVLFFFFKQKTAYEVRISDWSSDVCSSDLPLRRAGGDRAGMVAAGSRRAADPRLLSFGGCARPPFLGVPQWTARPGERASALVCAWAVRMTGYAELAAATNFSFLRGASQPADMVAQAISLGLQGIGIADRNTVAGVVRAHVALRKARAQAKEDRSEEHTSELQSLMRISYAVFFLKKKTIQTQKTTSIISIIKNLGQKINTINKYNRH